MTVIPYQVNEVLHLYNKMAKSKPSSVPEAEQREPQDTVNISAEARKRQVLDQVQTGEGGPARKTE